MRTFSRWHKKEAFKGETPNKAVQGFLSTRKEWLLKVRSMFSNAKKKSGSTSHLKIRCRKALKTACSPGAVQKSAATFTLCLLCLFDHWGVKWQIHQEKPRVQQKICYIINIYWVWMSASSENCSDSTTQSFTSHKINEFLLLVVSFQYFKFSTTGLLTFIFIHSYLQKQCWYFPRLLIICLTGHLQDKRRNENPVVWVNVQVIYELQRV